MSYLKVHIEHSRTVARIFAVAATVGNTEAIRVFKSNLIGKLVLNISEDNDQGYIHKHRREFAHV